MTTPDNAVVSTSYSGNAMTTTDQANRKRKSVADALGRLTAVYEDPTGLNYQTSYAYDVLDNLTTVTQGSQTRTFVYDSLKRLTSATNPESGTTTYQYDNNGNLTQKTDARSITTTIGYDVLNRPISKTYSDGTPTVAYFYDNQTLPAGAPVFDRGYSTGRPVAVTLGGGSAGSYYGYDALGRALRRIQQTDSVNYLSEATYNLAGGMTSQTYPSVPGYGDRRIVSYVYDGAGRLSSLNSNATSYAAGASVSNISYAPHDALSGETYGNGLVHAVTYNTRLQPNEIKLGTSGAPTSVLDLTYSYGTTNNNGNIASLTYSGGGLSYTQTFTYDSLNRLETAQENGGASWSQTEGYDRYGNRWVDYGGGQQSLYFNSANNRVTNSGYGYDAAGDVVSDGAATYGYDAEGRIKTVNGSTSHSYDGEGRRVRKYVGESTRFVYGVGGELVAEFDGSTGALKKEYVSGGGMTATIEPTAGTRYMTGDILGSPRVVTNSSGAVVSRHDYQPFGEELFAGTGGRTSAMGFGASDNLRQHFTGYQRDGETGLDFAQARYYASWQGRFTSPDSFGGRITNPQTLNLYAYALNNPLKYIDPSGHTPQDNNKPDKNAQVQKVPRPDVSKTYHVTVKVIYLDIAPSNLVLISAGGGTNAGTPNGRFVKASMPEIGDSGGGVPLGEGGGGGSGEGESFPPPSEEEIPPAYQAEPLSPFVRDFLSEVDASINAEFNAYVNDLISQGRIAEVIDETITSTEANFQSKLTLTADEALRAGEQFVGPGYRELGQPGSGVYRSADGLRGFRIDPRSLQGLHDPNVPHVHLEIYAPGGRHPIINNHIPFIDH